MIVPINQVNNIGNFPPLMQVRAGGAEREASVADTASVVND